MRGMEEVVGASSPGTLPNACRCERTAGSAGGRVLPHRRSVPLSDLAVHRPPTIRPVPLGETQTNAYLVVVESSEGRDCWIVDPGVDPQPLLDLVRREGLAPSAILLTHAHYDHIGGVDEVERAFGRLPIRLHEAERAFCETPLLNLSMFGGRPITCRSPDATLSDGEELHLGSTRWRVLHTPGHSPGSVTLYEARHGIAIAGDLLFAGSIGRIDFPTSDAEAMKRSLRRVLEELPDATRVLPGHGPATTIGEERRANPFLQDDLQGW